MNLTCEANGHPSPQYQWFKNSKEISTKNYIIIKKINTTEIGEYRCQVNNDAGTLSTQTSSSAACEFDFTVAAVQRCFIKISQNLRNFKTTFFAEHLRWLSFTASCEFDFTFAAVRKCSIKISQNLRNFNSTFFCRTSPVAASGFCRCSQRKSFRSFYFQGCCWAIKEFMDNLYIYISMDTSCLKGHSKVWNNFLQLKAL